MGPIWPYTIVGYGDGMVANRRQPIIWKIDAPHQKRMKRMMYASPDLNEL